MNDTSTGYSTTNIEFVNSTWCKIALAKAVSGHSGSKSAGPMAVVAMPVVDPKSSKWDRLGVYGQISSRV